MDLLGMKFTSIKMDVGIKINGNNMVEVNTVELEANFGIKCNIQPTQFGVIIKASNKKTQEDDVFFVPYSKVRYLTN